MGKTKIEWVQGQDGLRGETWNPTLGCSKISPGCRGCYAIHHVHRMAGNPNPKMKAANQGLTIMQGGEPNWTGKVRLIPERLEIPLRTRKPTTFFVNSLSDLFHEELSDEDIDRVFATMALCPQHRFQVLTKRAERLPKYFANLAYRTEIVGIRAEYVSGLDRYLNVEGSVIDDGYPARWPLPLPNVWLGVSVESRDYLHRIDHLRQTPAAVRFLSLEPLLEDLGDISKYLRAADEESLECSVCPWRGSETEATYREDHPAPDEQWFACPKCGEECAHVPLDELSPGIDWVIVGGESGPKARPMDIRWVRSIRDQCIAAGVSFFFKQHGEFAPSTFVPEMFWHAPVYDGPQFQTRAHGRDCHDFGGGYGAVRIGKKKAGRLLDGRTWDEMPEAKTQNA